MTRPPSTADAILSAAEEVLRSDPGASIDAVTTAAGVSRATFYRHYRSRSDLLEALDMEPDPDARQRILAAAVELIGRDGLRGMSMDELAAQAGVSRASVYRLFPGKPALFEALIAEYSPFDELQAVLVAMEDEPPETVLPALARAVATIGGPRIGLLRSLFFEVTAQSPEALAAADPRLRQVLGRAGHYLAGQIAAGRVRPMHPLIAAQTLMGPIVFHLVTRSEVEHLGVLDLSIEDAVGQLTINALRALAPDHVVGAGQP